MIRVTDKKRCSGCTACAAVCPADAVRMVPDPLGFRYPSVDADRCIGCGRCEEVCAFRPVEPRQEAPLWSLIRYEAELGKSQSGGFAYAAMSRWIDGGGVVYGVALDERFRAVHRRAADRAGIEAFRGSKYAQSDLQDTFRSVKADLEAGLRVLFTGMPCQCAGLASYVGETLLERLLLLDVVCHSVAPPAVVAAFLDEAGRGRGPLRSVRFRDPAFGWHCDRDTLSFEDGMVVSDAFERLYQRNFLFRPSCTACPFASVNRPSDLTAGDAWGIEAAGHPLGDGKAVSLCLLSTEKGCALFPELTELADPEPFRQPSLVCPLHPHPDAEAFVQAFLRRGFFRAYRKYGRKPFRERCKDLYVRVKHQLLDR